eukprot:TRINITY_DN27120_c0_g1_i3.p1 TRINITY_DN27120_c0_g1~~TRINITY_DN27120_c0_g1_i3.p1  ORF type:complete len:177 (+),score=37.14 TRINITY_DN27120_c0_g1_i3:49-579(+)
MQYLVSVYSLMLLFFFFFFKQKTAYEMQRGLVGSEMCIRDRYRLKPHTSCLFGIPSGEKVTFTTKGFRWSNPMQINTVGITGAFTLQIKEKNQASPVRTLDFGIKISTSERPYALTTVITICLLYTSDAADDTPCVDLGGRRIIKKKTSVTHPAHRKLRPSHTQNDRETPTTTPYT